MSDRMGSTGSPTLLLFPTELELERFREAGGLPHGLALTALCGFGPVAAAARTAQLCERLGPARVVLCGIAGTFDATRHPIGGASAFARVALDGVGVGQADAHLTAAALGFPQWPGSRDTMSCAIADELELAGADPGAPLLLTTCAASASPAEAELRRARHPRAAAEDMEGFGVALACALARTPLSIVRGFSNAVGDRDAARWRIPRAMAAAREVLLELLGAAR